jgi:hypothetical protein
MRYSPRCTLLDSKCPLDHSDDRRSSDIHECIKRGNTFVFLSYTQKRKSCREGSATEDVLGEKVSSEVRPPKTILGVRVCIHSNQTTNRVRVGVAGAIGVGFGVLTFPATPYVPLSKEGRYDSLFFGFGGATAVFNLTPRLSFIN